MIRAGVVTGTSANPIHRDESIRYRWTISVADDFLLPEIVLWLVPGLDT
jgi:hypothetical protein